MFSGGIERDSGMKWVIRDVFRNACNVLLRVTAIDVFYLF